MENLDDGIWIIDAEVRTIDGNDWMSAILGAAPPEMIGQHSFSFVNGWSVPIGGRAANSDV